MKKITKKSTSLKKAIELAAEELGTDKVEYQVVSNTSMGFLSFFGLGSVEIQAWEKGGARRGRGQDSKDDGKNSQPKKQRYKKNKDAAPSQPQETSSRRSSSRRSDRSAKKDWELQAKTLLEGVIKRSGDFSIEVEISPEEDRVILNVKGSVFWLEEPLQQENSHMVSHEVFESLEHLMMKVLNLRGGDKKPYVDVNGLRQQREQDVASAAKTTAESVLESKEEVALEYTSSYDRKIVHRALEEHDGVYTRSVGSGPKRRLIVCPGEKPEGQHEGNGRRRSSRNPARDSAPERV